MFDLHQARRDDSNAAQRSARRAACLRAYPANSTNAMARVLAVTMIADGRLESRELRNLGRANAYARLGMTQAEFMQVLFDLCEDLLTRAPRTSDGQCKLGPLPVAQMLAEVSEPSRRRDLVQLMIEVIRADGLVTRGESLIFWEALDAWGMTLADVMPSRGHLPKRAARPRKIRWPRLDVLCGKSRDSTDSHSGAMVRWAAVS